MNELVCSARLCRARAIQDLQYTKSGRPASQLAAVVEHSWHPSNGDLASRGVTNTDERQWRWWCQCMQHTHTCTTRCLVDKHPEGMPCDICTDHADSWHERVVRGVLLGWGGAFEVYPKLLGGRYGSVDLFVIHANLVIEVDGPSHMEEACRGVSLHQRESPCLPHHTKAPV